MVLIWDKVSADIKKNLMISLSIIKIFCKPKWNLMGMKLQIFIIKKFLRCTLIILFLTVISLDSALRKDENYYSQVFLKECKYIEKKKVIRHISHSLSDFSSSISLMKGRLKQSGYSFLRKQISKCKFENLFFEGVV